MSVPINTKKIGSAGTGAKDWIPVNRWGPSNYTINLTFNGAATVNVEATLVQLNRGEAAVSTDIFTLPSLGAITANVAVQVSDTPFEFIRVNQTAGVGSVDIHIMQGGRTGTE